MYGWDRFDATPIDWHLTAVFPTCDHEGEEFVYSEDLWATAGDAAEFTGRNIPWKVY